jgi:AraC-like DNA-binding protein
VELGEAEIAETLSEEELIQLNAALLNFGLELLKNKKSILVEKIKTVIIEMIHFSEELPKTKFSIYLSEKLHYDYTYLSNLFSAVKGTIIERFIISHKIERVKQMLVYSELTLSEIACRLHFSNVSHLSQQSKNLTGLAPSRFREMKQKKLIPLENL